MTRGIYYNLLKTFAIAKKENIPTNLAADRMAEQRIETVSRARRTFLGVNPGPLRQLEFRRTGE